MNVMATFSRKSNFIHHADRNTDRLGALGAGRTLGPLPHRARLVDAAERAPDADVRVKDA